MKGIQKAKPFLYLEGMTRVSQPDCATWNTAGLVCRKHLFGRGFQVFFFHWGWEGSLWSWGVMEVGACKDAPGGIGELYNRGPNLDICENHHPKPAVSMTDFMMSYK